MTSLDTNRRMDKFVNEDGRNIDGVINRGRDEDFRMAVRGIDGSPALANNTHTSSKWIVAWETARQTQFLWQRKLKTDKVESEELCQQCQPLLSVFGLFWRCRSVVWTCNILDTFQFRERWRPQINNETLATRLKRMAE